MVGSGALALPKIFGEAGLVLSTLFLFLVACLSMHTQHLLLEAQGIAAVLESLRQHASDSIALAERSRPGDAVWSFPAQIASMCRLLLPPWGEALWYAIIITYLVPDLAVYSVFVPATVAHVFPGVSVAVGTGTVGRWITGLVDGSDAVRGNGTATGDCEYQFPDPDESPADCRGSEGTLRISEDGVYRITLLALALFATPLTFYSLKKTTALQVGTLVTRIAVFGAMTACAIYFAITRDFGGTGESAGIGDEVEEEGTGEGEDHHSRGMLGLVAPIGGWDEVGGDVESESKWGGGGSEGLRWLQDNASANGSAGLDPIHPGNSFHPSHLSGAPDEPRVRLWAMAGLPLLFGGAVYAMIAQQYVPSLFAGLGVGPGGRPGGGVTSADGGPLPDRWFARGIVVRVIGCVLGLYLVVCWAAVWAYHGLVQPEGGCDASTRHACGLQDLYMFGFGYVRPWELSRFILLAPLLSMLSSFPLIAITLRDSLILLYLRTCGGRDGGVIGRGLEGGTGTAGGAAAGDGDGVVGQGLRGPGNNEGSIEMSALPAKSRGMRGADVSGAVAADSDSDDAPLMADRCSRSSGGGLQPAVRAAAATADRLAPDTPTQGPAGRETPTQASSPGLGLAAPREQAREQPTPAQRASKLADSAVAALVTPTPPQPPASDSGFGMRCGAALLATLPAYAVAAWTRNMDGLVEVTGAFGGAAIMFVVPVLLASRARAIRERLLGACEEAVSRGTDEEKAAARTVRSAVESVADATRPPEWQRHWALLALPLAFAAVCLVVNLWTLVLD